MLRSPEYRFISTHAHSVAWALLLAFTPSLVGEEQHVRKESAADHTFSILEVTGNYAKVPRPENDVSKGVRVALVDTDDQSRTKAIGRITAVEKDYVVVQFASRKPEKNDLVRFSALPLAESPSPTRNAESRKDRRERLEKVRATKEQQTHQEWLNRLKSRSVEAWDPATDEQHEAALARYEELGTKVQQMFPAVQFYETKRFLFYSNMPPQQVAPYVRSLDAMYEMMARTFGVGKDEDVWLGRKAPVFAFAAQQQFAAFEQRFFESRPGSAYGVCHQSSGGEVVIACYRGNDPNDFGQMVVHETSHGFIHRYKTKARLPVWVNEGMAEYIGERMVPASNDVRNKERGAQQRLKQNPVLGANFFQEDAKLEGWQYGVASSLNKFLITGVPGGQKKYVAFVELLKEGVPWGEALQQTYQATPAALLHVYGRAIGVDGLRP